MIACQVRAINAWELLTFPDSGPCSTTVTPSFLGLTIDLCVYNNSFLFIDCVYIIHALLQSCYDTELQALHEMIQQKVSTLLSDSENIVKQTLLENGITRLCVFFGRQKVDELSILPFVT